MQFVILLALVGVALGATCRDGTQTCDCDFGHGCRSWTSRRNRVESIATCPPAFVVDIASIDLEFCDTRTRCKLFDGVPPCGYQRDCSNLANGNYADIDLDCIFYYTCLNGIFFGHQKCPDGTVFHNDIQNCNFPQDVPPPCGTAPPSTSSGTTPRSTSTTTRGGSTRK